MAEGVMKAYYNEIDPHAAAWLRELIKAGHIADGDVDERSIEDVFPGDLAGYAQHHFFAGIGTWSYALRKAGWPDNRPVWTGSCPCQPFSQAGKGSSFADERHLWPAFHHLIKERRPVIVFGEQVASKDADAWIDTLQTDLEAVGYAVGAVPFPSAGVGAPHIRDRLYWVAYSNDEHQRPARQHTTWSGNHSMAGEAGGVADSTSERRERGQDSIGPAAKDPAKRGEGLPDAERCGEYDRPGPTNGFWRDADWLGCRDGKWRPVKPGTFPLAHGTAARVVRGCGTGLPIDANKTGEARVMRLRGYGNSINAVQAQAFVEAFMDAHSTNTPQATRKELILRADF